MIKEIDKNYSITDAGEVFSRPRERTKGGKLKPIVNKQGYLVVMLSPSRKPIRIHRLVAKAFIPNPKNYPDVNHKDGNKQNNHHTNLEWCDAQWNVQHYYNMKRDGRFGDEA